MSLNIISDFLSETDINYILSLSEVIEAKKNIDSKINGSIYFSITLTQSIRNIIFEKFGLKLDSVPMRWIKGDTHPHVDTGSKQFQKTHLVYLTDSPGKFMIENESYSMTKGTAFVFNEGLNHETIDTGFEPRLLLGPMSEQGIQVGGATTISAPGGTTAYIRDVDVFGIQYSYDKINWNGISLPIYVENTSPLVGRLTIEFITDITIYVNIFNFICISDNIQFGSTSLKIDGTRPIITITASNYDGLIQNGSSGYNGYNNISIYNLFINGTGGTQQAGAGWFGQKYFGKGATNNYIINCSSNGDIGSNSGLGGGGILGDQAGNVTLIGCSSYGNMATNASNVGGIVGYLAGTGGTVTCNSCWSTCNMYTGNDGAGGIVGGSSVNVIVRNCYSTGSISGNNCGGIVGSNSGSTNTTIENCYSTGIIDGGNGGGICGSFGTDTYYGSINNCYSTGIIDGANLAGGICGWIYNNTSTILTISHCYTTGTTTGDKGYIIGNETTIPSGCYSEADNGSSGWNFTNAQNTLTGSPTYPPITWISIGASVPFELFNMGYTPYSTTNIISNSLVRNSSLSVTPGGTTISGPLNVSSYFLLNSELVTANIDPNNGAISVPSSTAPGTYTLWIYNLGSYNVTTVTLTVTEPPRPTPGGPYFPIQSVSLNQKAGFCGTRAVSATAVGIGAIRGKGSSTRIFNNCKGNNSVNFKLCQFRVLGFK